MYSFRKRIQSKSSQEKTNKAMINKMRWKRSTIPVQFTPSPVYPELHAHVNDPGVLVHVALPSQLWLFA